MDYAQLTGQSRYTIDVFSPIRNIWNRARDWIRASTTAAGIAWMSRHIYYYHRLMLMNLSPRSPATHHWPLYYYPPPHFLVGYQFVVRVCNDYIFDSRAYSRLKYHEVLSHNQQKINWSMLANCTYTINTGAYHRFVDLENFENTLSQVQQAILAERIVADLALITPMRGFGITRMQEGENVPVEQLLQEQYKHLGQCQEQAWGMAERIRFQQSTAKVANLLCIIRKLKAAYFNYLVCEAEEKLSLPCDSDWVEAFVEYFTTEGLSPFYLQNIQTQKLLKSIVDVLSLPGPSPYNLTGGAFELRPREGGRAVTETMRRMRGEIIERFVDRLPVRTRRRREPRMSPVAEVEQEEEHTFGQEVRQTIAGIIQLLEEEISMSARDTDFFNFAVRFYEVMTRLDTLGEITEGAIRRWVMYFFVAEHIASTLNYLHRSFINSASFTRHAEILLAQVVMRGRDEAGNVIYNRVWTENGMEGFINLMRRISVDLAGTIERAGQAELNEEEIEQFMTDIAFHENSGDVQEILNQLSVDDATIDSMELSFRFKVLGPVIFSQKREIQNINRRVVTLATQMRRNRTPLPVLNEVVQLPHV